MKARLFLKLVLVLSFSAGTACSKPNVGELPDYPEATGMVVYENTLEGKRTELNICDIRSGQITCLSDTWNLNDLEHPVISKDGKTVIFTAVSKGKAGIWQYDVCTGKQPVCLTDCLDGNFSDAVFMPDGNSLLLIRNGQVVTLDLNTPKVTLITFGGKSIYSSPCVSEDGANVVYVKTDKGASRLECYDVATQGSKTLFNDSSIGIESPIFLNGNTLAFVERKTFDNSSVVVSQLNGKNRKSVAGQGSFCSPAVVDQNWILVSLAKNGSDADLVLVCPSSGSMTDLEQTVPGLNESGSQTAPSYTAANVSIAEPQNGGREEGEENDGDDILSDTERPALRGKMVYHNYTSYDAMDSKMYVYDFATDILTCISKNWTGLKHPMNGHFSPDGKFITFMAIGEDTDSWDVFLYDAITGKQPLNLTPGRGERDEDPKFSHDGKSVIFKRNDRLAEITLSTRRIEILTPQSEALYSMPYYTMDDRQIVFGGKRNGEEHISIWDKKTNKEHLLYDNPGVVEYYPIVIDNDSFYYTAHVSSSNHHDQVCKGFFSKGESEILPFNKTYADYSDASPVGKGWLLLCSTQNGGRGQYDLYLANEKSGAIFTLSQYNLGINTGLNELGPSYFIE